MMLTTKEAIALTGRSESFLRRNECAWCGQTLLRQVKGNCGAFYDEPCDPKKPRPWWRESHD
jgi:hypothetical protein